MLKYEDLKVLGSALVSPGPRFSLYLFTKGCRCNRYFGLACIKGSAFPPRLHFSPYLQAPQQETVCHAPAAQAESDRTLRLTWPIHRAQVAVRHLLIYKLIGAKN